MSTITRLNQIQRALTDQDIVFCYSGYLSEEALLNFGKTIRQSLELVQIDKKIARSVFAIFVEETQNIVRYSKAILPAEADDSEVLLRHGFIAVGTPEKDVYFVCCGNLVLKEDVQRLSRHLNHIATLDADGLKALYKQILKDAVPEGSKGAGVGFVDIARRANGALEYDFKDVDDTHAYFYLKAYA